MKVLGVGRGTRGVLFAGVRLFGWLPWWGTRRLKRRGLERIAERAPTRAVETGLELMRGSVRRGDSP